MAQPPAASPRCLLVEDEVLIGMDLEDSLYQAGFDVRWAASTQTAAELLKCTHFDVAVLDVTVRSEPCIPLASELKRRRIPFLVYSGHPREASLGFQDAPWLAKPADAGVLVTALADILDVPRAAASNGTGKLFNMPQAGSR